MLFTNLIAFGSLFSLSQFASSAPSPPSYGPSEPFFYKGFDLSSLKIEEDGGAVYKDTQRGNITRPVEDILGDGGMNVVRLRLWVWPKAPYDGMLFRSVHHLARIC